jgi:Na+/H+ antiporter NhaD/arsenite permease-like protein
MFILMVVVFVLGYMAIALEHPLKIDKAAPALLIGVLTWVLYITGCVDILTAGLSGGWNEYAATHSGEAGKAEMMHFITHNQLLEHLGEISEILFFLLGAMTIVEIVDRHGGFTIITDKIKTTNKVKLLWIISTLTFFMSAALDNLTTTIVMVALIRKLIRDKENRWFFASMVVLAANAGGAWSPIGDVTTIMLWIGGQVTAAKIIMMVFLPSLVCMIVPLLILSVKMKGNIERPSCGVQEEHVVDTSYRLKVFILSLGVGALLFVPVFKTVTHLPPYLGMLFGLSILWITTEVLHRARKEKKRPNLQVASILTRIDVPTILFFLGILLAVASLQSAGHLGILANTLDEYLGNIFLIDLAIGVLSSIVDNVPLVAGAMGMYPVLTPEAVLAAADPAYAHFFPAERSVLGVSGLLRWYRRQHPDHRLRCRCCSHGDGKN